MARKGRTVEDHLKLLDGFLVLAHALEGAADLVPGVERDKVIERNLAAVLLNELELAERGRRHALLVNRLLLRIVR